MVPGLVDFIAHVDFQVGRSWCSGRRCGSQLRHAITGIMKELSLELVGIRGWAGSKTSYKI